MVIHNRPKRTIPASSGLTVTNGIKVSHRVVCQRGRWDLKGEIVGSHIGWRGERNIPYKDVETSPNIHVLKP